MSTIYGYIRASTSGQQYTYEAQMAALKPHFEAWHKNGGTLGYVFKDEAVSGGTEIFERPKGRELWKVLKPGDKIVFAKLDRGFRNFLDYAKFAELMKTRGVAYVSADLGLDSSSDTGEFVYSIMASFAQLERKFISRRTKEGLAMRKQKHLPKNNQAPPGWRTLPNGTMDADPIERKVIDWIDRQKRLNHSFRAIAKQLGDWGVKRANGTSFGREFCQIALFAKEHKYPGQAGWRQQWLREKAEKVLQSSG
jgi:putative DNA-invertase from lambdoid prophage Rac